MPMQTGDTALTQGTRCAVRPLLAALLLAALLAASLPAEAKTPDWKAAKPAAVLENLKMPLDIELAPDGSIVFAELAGNVSRHDPATGQTTRMHEVQDVVTGGERGLVGLALSRDFAKSGTYFLYYTQRTDDPDGGINRLVRVTDGKETLLVTVPGWKEHNGGRIVVAPDGTLFVGTGENQKRDPAQDTASLLGKVLR
ncbi:MAG TPA: PQQ-dependent sugar dehydrogenase, partial [Candidatus Thermoplasmatota archaeon]|nr:PQQ-dependent sugar dehydrogenase [Candidatus Thermoplasmatota archaeon]